jgi:succinyldiaminopimelate transaminase
MADQPFEPPPYPYDRLDELQAVADGLPGGCVDLSIGTPCDPPPPVVVTALAASGTARGYPPSIGTVAFREAAAGWMKRRLNVDVDPATEIGACVGTKELVAGLPHWLKLRDPTRDTVLYPSPSYPTYAMGATLARCRAVSYSTIDDIADDDARRALALWVNSPSNPTGGLADLGAAVGWGRAHNVPVLSDECYVEFTWDGAPRTVLDHGTQGVLAVHSLSKRSNLAGVRIGFYAGDADLVHYLREVRKHAGFMAPGPVQAAAVLALGDDDHVDQQRRRYHARLQRLVTILRDGLGIDAPMPAGAFYLWAPAPGRDHWGLTKRLAAEAGALVSPGDLYGPEGEGFVRIAAVQPDDRIELIADRLGAAQSP